MNCRRGLRASVFIGVFVVAGLAMACGGSTGSNAAVTSPTAGAATSATTAASATMPGTSPSPCDPAVLRTDAREPIGAGAIMRSVVVVADVGPTPCRLPVPRTVRFLARDGKVLATGRVVPSGPADVDVAPSRPPTHGEPRPPAGAAFIGLEWTWRDGAGAACATNPGGFVRVAAEFPGGFTLEAQANVESLPCNGDFLFEMDVVPE